MRKTDLNRSRPTRRRFLALAGAGAAFGGGALPDRARAGYWRVKERKIALYNLWTGEYLDLVYWREGDYLPAPLADFDYLLRDWRSGQVAEIFRGVFDQLFWLGRTLGGDAPFGVVSCFRSDSTNRMLRESGEGVADNSLHIYGMAIDVRREGFAAEQIWGMAVRLGMGGAGLYRGSDFVHLDVGPARSWNG